MAYIDAPMLFLPPQPPLPIPTERALTIGRSRGCDLRLPDTDASRRHAEISAADGAYVLRDLDSTNGTFVNGELVKERALEPGDRIQIGSATITFCRLGRDPGASDPSFSSEKTVLTERPVPSDVFHGELAEVPVFAVLQILELSRNSGVVAIDSEGGVGRLWLREGKPIHAETKQQKGFDAALALVHASSGRFSFTPGGEPPELTIEASVTELLLEATRALDEAKL